MEARARWHAVVHAPTDAPRTSAVTPSEERVLTGVVTVVEAVQALAVLAGAIGLAVLLQRLLVRAIDRGDADRHAGLLVGRFLGVLVVCLGALYALDLVGVRIGPLLGALGVGGIAVAFAAQDILQNLIAGVLLQVRRPFRVGEQVATVDYEGVVRDVNFRTVVLDTYDGLRVYVPNAEVLKNPIVNYTRTPWSRTDLDVGVAYDTDLTRARHVLLAAVRSCPQVRPEPPPEVWVHAFGESSVDLVVRYWHPADIASRWRVRSEVAVAVKAALDGAGITIPFPQRVLWSGSTGGPADVATATGEPRGAAEG